ncbi:MAG: glycine zipper 2TM domain-containing protein [Massilia sp.]
MEHQTATAAPRMHPLMVTAAASVTLFSLLGVAAVTGLLPSSHGQTTPTKVASAQIDSSAPARFVTPDGQVLEAVPNAQALRPVDNAPVRQVVQAPAPVQHKVVHHYAQQSPAPRYQSAYAPQPAHPVRSYVSDMHPVGTGVGAVVGGLLGHQVGGGNGKKIATVAGVLLGGYAGNEIAHDRNPIPGY